MSDYTKERDPERLMRENARLKAALEEAEYECERLEIINSNLQMQLDECNRELERNIEVLQGFKSEIETLVNCLKNVSDS